MLEAVDFNKDDQEEGEDKPRPQYCVRCKDMFSVYSLLSPRVIRLTKTTGKPFPKPADHDKWKECLGYGTVYAKYEVKQEPHLTTLIDPDTDPSHRDNNIIEWVRERRKFDRTGKTQLTKKRKRESNNHQGLWFEKRITDSRY